MMAGQVVVTKVDESERVEPDKPWRVERFDGRDWESHDFATWGEALAYWGSWFDPLGWRFYHGTGAWSFLWTCRRCPRGSGGTYRPLAHNTANHREKEKTT